MGYDGNGNFLRIHSWVADAAAGIKIRSDRHDAEDDNFANGLSNALTRDGQSQPTADIPMNEYKIIALGAPEDPADAATKAYVDSKKTYTNDIEVTDQVIFKDGPTTRGTITGQIGSTNPAAMIFEAHDKDGLLKNRMTLNEEGLSLLNGALSVPGAVGAGSIVSSGQISGTKGVFTANIDVTKTLYARDGSVMRGYIDWAIGAGVAGAMSLEIDSDAAVMVNRAAMNSTGWYLANGHYTAENGGLILRGDTGVLLTSQGATPKIRGSLICDISSPGGTTAVRSYNSAGVIDGLFYINSTESAVDKAVFSLYNTGVDMALWFRKGDGNIKAGVYCFTGGTIDLRAHNTTSNTQSNVFRVGADRQNYTEAYGMTYNSAGTSGDVFQNHRVTTGRATRLYFSQIGDVVIQQSDDNFASHFINIMNYVRSAGTTTFAGKVISPSNGFEISGPYGGGCGLYLGNGDNATLSSYNLMLRSWNGIGFPSTTDGVNKITFECRTGRGIFYDLKTSGDIYVGNTNTRYQADGNVIFSQGMSSAFGNSLYDQLGALNASKATVYTGGGQDDTIFPIGHTVMGQTGDGIVLIRNSAQLCYLSSNYSYSYTGSTGCAGTWRMRGGYDSPGSGAWAYSWQRMG